MEFRFIELSFLWYLKEKKIHKNHHLGQSYSKIKNKKKTIFLVCVLFCKCERSHVLERVMFKSYVVNIRSFNSFWREKNNNNNFEQIFNSGRRKKWWVCGVFIYQLWTKCYSQQRKSLLLKETSHYWLQIQYCKSFWDKSTFTVEYNST